jgi:hypothetical protein
MTKLSVHLCTKCGEQTIWTPDGALHDGNISDHLAEPGRILTLEWEQEAGIVTIQSDQGDSP